MVELIEGKRVRLTRHIKGAQAGQTGYLHQTREGGAWGVVWDAEWDFDMMTTHISDETPDGERVKLLDVVEAIGIPLEEGRRVRLLVSVHGGNDFGDYEAGETGYLHCWCEADCCDDESNWGVVFDRDEAKPETVIRALDAEWKEVRLIDVVELLTPPADELQPVAPRDPELEGGAYV